MPLAPPAARAADRRTLSPHRRAAAAGTIVVALAGTLVGCDDDQPPSATTSAAPATTAAPASTAPATDGVLPEGFTTVAIELRGEGGSTPCCVHLADAPEERSRGLMGVTDLAGAAGMLFQYPSEQSARFYMFRTPMPLSIAFFDGDGRFVSATDMAPCTSDDSERCPRYDADAPFRWALEVPRGELERLGVTDGTTLEIVPGSERPTCP